MVVKDENGNVLSKDENGNEVFKDTSGKIVARKVTLEKAISRQELDEYNRRLNRIFQNITVSTAHSLKLNKKPRKSADKIMRVLEKAQLDIQKVDESAPKAEKPTH